MKNFHFKYAGTLAELEFVWQDTQLLFSHYLFRNCLIESVDRLFFR